MEDAVRRHVFVLKTTLDFTVDTLGKVAPCPPSVRSETFGKVFREGSDRDVHDVPDHGVLRGVRVRHRPLATPQRDAAVRCPSRFADRLRSRVPTKYQSDTIVLWQ